MSSKLAPYAPLEPIVSSLFRNPPDAVPPTDELESLHTELQNLKQRSLERAKKAGDDLRTIEESMKRMKEKEKGKAKAVEKVKRERGSATPMPEVDESRASGSLHSGPTKARFTPSHQVSIPPSSARSSVDPRRPTLDDAKKKKKKRKRDFEDSDAEPEPQRPRKGSPQPPPVPHQPSHPVKASKSMPTSSHTHTKHLPGPDFTVPGHVPLLPTRPPVPPPPIPGPSKPTEVTEDFSKAKQPAQTLVSTFYTSIEPWIRNIKEEDVGFLEYTGDEVEPYVMPKLGPHYTEQWELEDLKAQEAAGFHTGRDLSIPLPSSSFSAPVPKWDPSTLSEPDLVNEERGHGPLTERLVSALLPMPDMSGWKGVKAAEDAMEGRPGGYGAAMARREKVNVSDLEARIRDTMRFNGLLDGLPDYSEKVDDPIATALRHAQAELRTVVATNKARKERLASIAYDRLGYQEYLDLRDSIDKNISATYAKLQKKDVPKVAKKKKKGEANGTGNGAGANGSASTTPAVPPPCPAALGLSPDEENRLTVSEQLKQLVETRRQWVDQVGSVFERKQEESPGRIWGLPKTSVYEGLDQDVRRIMELGASATPSADAGRRADKGKHRARGDEMDVG
ncbi:hypothetical protein PLICRDRAFT_41071 [Plicaturopsis crispa FD-325 SS-3]|nr:hypothetical protein PLICRDRAFT_41071 [Plicaturopsis crispa FD-325 SS-3]